jgi:hypothetical protein
LLINPNHNLSYILPTNWFQLMFDFFFPLKSEFRDAINLWKQSNFGYYTISIQIRAALMGWKNTTDHTGAPPLPPKELFYQTAETLSLAVKGNIRSSYSSVIFKICNAYFRSSIRKYYLVCSHSK